MIRFAALAFVLSVAPAQAFDGLRPDPALTPGAIRTTDRTDICQTKTSTVRNVSGSDKLAVYRRYGMTGPNDTIPGTNLQKPYEVDHLISLELGGSNDITNLWVQPYEGTSWNAHVKDRLENSLRKQVCLGRMTVEAAQAEV